MGACRLTRGWSGPARDQLVTAGPRWAPAAQPQDVRLRTMTTLKIALLQLVSFRRDVDANLHKGDHFCRRAASSGAHVALFPELWSIGYQPFDPEKPSDREDWLSLAVARDGLFVEHFRHLARELVMAIGITYLE